MPMRAIIIFFILFIISLSAYADHPFAIDNIDSTMPIALNYYYSNLANGDYQYVNSLSSGRGGFKNIIIPGNTVPQFWKITGIDGHQIECANNGIIKIDDYALQYDNLLLEVNFYNKSDQSFLAMVIDLDGDGPYSNRMSCKIAEEKPGILFS